MKNYVNKQTFDTLHIELSKHQQEQIETAENDLQAIQEIIPDAELLYDVAFDLDGSHWFRATQIGFIRNGVQFYILKSGSSKKPDYLFSIDTSDLTYTDNYDCSFAGENLEKPNVVHVLSEKKVQKWIEYYLNYYASLQLRNDQHRKMIEEFRAKLAALPDVIWLNNNEGEINRNGLEYSFTIERTRIIEKIKIEWCIESLGDFLLMSDNKFTGQKSK